MKKIAFLIFAMSFSGSIVLAADTNKKTPDHKMPTLTTEQRQKMADAHEKMAACLRSDKPLEECHKDMVKACHDNMGKHGCPMMGGKGMGMHHHSDTDKKENESESKK